MTLLASFEALGSPVMIGDLLITANCAPVSNIATPLVRIDNSKVFADKVFSITGISQKLVLIHPKLCFGWAGSAIAAKALIDHLRRYVQGKEHLDDAEFMAHFYDYPSGDCIGLEFIIHCSSGAGNRYLSNVPRWPLGEIAEIRVCGTGTPHFVTWVETAFASAPPMPVDANYNKLAASALMYIGLASAQQAKSGEGLADRWGGGFEMIYFSNGDFIKPNILWLYWTIEKGNSGSTARLGSKTVFQTCPDSTLVYLEYDASNCETNAYSVTPPFDGDTFDYEQTLSADHFHSVSLVRFSDHPGGVGAFVDFRGQGNAPSVGVVWDGDAFGINFSSEFVQRFSATMPPEYGAIVELDVWGSRASVLDGAQWYGFDRVPTR